MAKLPENALAMSTPTMDPIGTPSPTAAEAIPRRATGTRSGITEVIAAWKTFITAWPRHQAMATSRIELTAPSSSIAGTASRPPPRIHGLRRPDRSESAPATGLKTVAKTALTPPIRPSMATLWCGEICSTCSGSRMPPTPM